MLLQAQATPEVLGLNVLFSAGRNNTLFVCVWLHLKSPLRNSFQCLYSGFVCCVRPQNGKMPLNMWQHMLPIFSLVFCLAYIMCVVCASMERANAV